MLPPASRFREAGSGAFHGTSRFAQPPLDNVKVQALHVGGLVSRDTEIVHSLQYFLTNGGVQ